MPWQFFTDYNQNNPITSQWLNGISNFIFGATGKNAQTSPAAWVRFSVSGGVATIQQSYGVASVVRTATGTYTITYSQTLLQAANCYNINTSSIGMNAASTETVNSVVIETGNSSGILIDPTSVSVVIFGSYQPQF